MVKQEADTVLTLTPKYAVWIGIGYLALVTQIPFILTLYYSTLRWNLLYPGQPITCVWLNNYLKVFTETTFTKAISNTLLFTIAILGGSLLLGLALALLLHRPIPGKSLIRTLLMSPFLVMTSVVAIIWKNMLLDPTYGFVNNMNRMIGLPMIDLVGSHPMATIILIGIWEWTPFMMLILNAAIESVPPDIVEAAAIDGAGNLAKFRYVILPHLSKYFLICILLGAVMLLPLFGEIHLTTAGGPGSSTTNLTYLVFQKAFQGYNIGLAAANAVITVLITMVLATLLMKLFTREA
ncbi:sugar ABC transporter permease [Moorella naiadis]|uniref:carbohydrate ABC transporter permease n=1 Tax=Moorella naiadis (nom. illeg.) TaxID=3093670 RepID=UPI003D9CBBE6